MKSLRLEPTQGSEKLQGVLRSDEPDASKFDGRMIGSNYFLDEECGTHVPVEQPRLSLKMM